MINVIENRLNINKTSRINRNENTLNLAKLKSNIDSIDTVAFKAETNINNNKSEKSDLLAGVLGSLALVLGGLFALKRNRRNVADNPQLLAQSDNPITPNIANQPFAASVADVKPVMVSPSAPSRIQSIDEVLTDAEFKISSVTYPEVDISQSGNVEKVNPKRIQYPVKNVSDNIRPALIKPTPVGEDSYSYYHIESKKHEPILQGGGTEMPSPVRATAYMPYEIYQPAESFVGGKTDSVKNINVKNINSIAQDLLGELEEVDGYNFRLLKESENPSIAKKAGMDLIHSGRFDLIKEYLNSVAVDSSATKFASAHQGGVVFDLLYSLSSISENNQGLKSFIANLSSDASIPRVVKNIVSKVV